MLNRALTPLAWSTYFDLRAATLICSTISFMKYGTNTGNSAIPAAPAPGCCADSRGAAAASIPASCSMISMPSDRSSG